MIRVGIGGWSFAPWRETFYPKDVSKAQELHYASRALTTIEINATYYRHQSPKTFARWREETPDDFVFSVKANRFATNRAILAEAGDSVARFVGSGITELGPKLGPILWQFAPTKKFNPEDFGAFLALLPKTHAGSALKHALEIRNESFCDPAFVALARKHDAAIVFADSEKYPAIADVTADFTYARLQGTQSGVKTGYSSAALKKWAQAAKAWSAGGIADDLPRYETKAPSKKKRDVFVYMISGAKERAPAAAMALIELIS
jgi:uncharacterized protein YecE (DUF72 family)